MGLDKKYLDRQIAAADPQDHKASVRFVTTVALAAYTRVGNVITASGNGALGVQDGVTPVQGNSLLLTTGASGSDNGIYVVTQLGSGGTPFILTRRSDADTAQFVNSGMRCGVEEGTLFGGTGTEFVLVTPNPIVLNTTALDFEPVTGGAAARDPQFWAGSSNDDGTANGDPDIVTIGGAFVSVPDRINQYVLDCTTDLPAFGIGDHNRTVTYKEPNSGAASSLVVTAQGATQINFGRFIGRTSVTLHGQGAKHVFRYDETIDKFVVVEGAQALSGKELRSTADYIEEAVDTVTIADLPAATNNDVTATGISSARYVFIEAASGGPFASITGLDATAVEDTDFESTKYLVNISGQTLTIPFNDGGSSAPNQFSGTNAGPVLVPDQSSLRIQYFGDIGKWFVAPPNKSNLWVNGVVETTDATPTTIFTYTTQTDERAIALSLHIFSREPATDDSLNYVVEALFNRAAGGVVTSKDENFTSAFKDQAAWDVTFVVAGSNISVKVTGEAGKTIEWRVTGGVNEHG